MGSAIRQIEITIYFCINSQTAKELCFSYFLFLLQKFHISHFSGVGNFFLLLNSGAFLCSVLFSSSFFLHMENCSWCERNGAKKGEIYSHLEIDVCVLRNVCVLELFFSVCFCLHFPFFLLLFIYLLGEEGYKWLIAISIGRYVS